MAMPWLAASTIPSLAILLQTPQIRIQMELPQKRSYQQLIRRKFSLPTASQATHTEGIRRKSADNRYTIVGICAMAKKVSLGPAWNLSVLTKSIICLSVVCPHSQDSCPRSLPSTVRKQRVSGFHRLKIWNGNGTRKVKAVKWIPR